MSGALARIQVLATSWLTYLTIIAAILVDVAHELDSWAGAPKWLVQLVARAVVIVSTVVVMIRKHTPVAPGEEGLLSPPKPPGPGVIEDPDAGLTLVEVLVVLVIVILLLAALGTLRLS